MIKVIKDTTGEEMNFDGKLSLVLYNPLFNDYVTHSFSVKVSNTRYNKFLTGYLHRPEVYADNEMAITIIIDYTFVLKGVFEITGADDDYITLYFKGQNNFWSWADETKLKDLSYMVSYNEWLALPWTSDVKNKIAGVIKRRLVFNIVPPVDVFAQFRNDAGFDEFPTVNFYRDYINYQDDNGVVQGEHTQTTPIPAYKIMDIIKMILFEFDLVTVRNDTDADVNNIYLQSLNANGIYKLEKIDPVYTNYAFFMSNEEDDFYYIDGVPGSTLWNQVVTRAAYYHYIYLSYIWVPDGATGYKSLQGKNVKIELDGDNLKILDYKPSELELVVGNIHIDFCFCWVIRENTIYRLIEHLPDWTVKTFIQNFETLFNLKFIIDESQNNVRIVNLDTVLTDNDFVDITPYSGYIKDVKKAKKNGYLFSWAGGKDDFFNDTVKEFDVTKIKGTVDFKENLPLIGNLTGDVYLVSKENNYYQWNETVLTNEGSWEFLSNNFLPCRSGNEEYKVSCNFVPLCEDFSVKKTYTTTVTFNARIEQAVSFLCFNQEHQEAARIFQLYEDFFGNKQAMRRHFSRITSSSYYTFSNLDLDFDGIYGIVEKYHKKTIEYVCDNGYSEVEINVEWPLYMLNSFKWEKKHKSGNMLYFVDRIELEAGAEPVKFVKSIFRTAPI